MSKKEKTVKAGNTNIKIKLTPIDRAFYVVVDIYLAICGVIVLLPLLHVLAQSLSETDISGFQTYWVIAFRAAIVRT